jgi:putative ABC transport system permease protein
MDDPRLARHQRDSRRSLSERLYRLVVRFYPQEFREQFGGDMTAAYRAARADAEARGRVGVLEFWLGLGTDALVRAPVEHLHMTMNDLRYAARGLRHSPVFTLVAVLTIALGIGANTAIFSAVRAVALRPLGLTDAERLVQILQKNERLRVTQFAVSVPDYVSWRELSTVFEELAGWRGGSVTLTSGGEPQRMGQLQATATVLPLLGLRPLIGRNFLPEEDRPGGPQVAILFESLWRERFGADPTILGRAVTLDGVPTVVIGVVPDANFPSSAKLMVPLAADLSREDRGNHMMIVMGRLRKGVTLEQAQREMDGISRRLEQLYPEDRDWGVMMVTFYDWIIPQAVRTGLYTLLGSVVVVLLIACSNVANLMLARAALRRRELAVRLALGASRLRLAREVLTESVLVSGAGGVAGLLVAWWSIPALRSRLADTLPRADEIQIDAQVLLFTLAITLLTGILFGVLPAAIQSRHDVAAALKEGGRGGGARQQGRARQLLVIGQVALATILLAAGALLVQSFHRLQQVNLGFDASHLTAGSMGLPEARYRSRTDAIQFYNRLLESLQSTPGITAAALTSGAPFEGGNTGMSVRPIGSATLSGEDVQADWRMVSDDYFRTLSIPLLRGRAFASVDGSDKAQLVIILSDGLARRFWPAQDPIGREVQLGNKRICRVVGIVGDVHNVTLDTEPRPTMYFPTRQLLWPTMTVVARSAPGIDAAPLIRRQVSALDPQLAVFNMRTMAAMLEGSMSQPRMTAWLVGLFALVAILLAAIGVYGVLAYLVAQRTQEIGVRMALGAPAYTVVRLVLGHALRLAGVGVAIGLAGAGVLGPSMASLLFGVGPRDALTFASVGVGLIGIALAASYLPARRATRVDPLVALRAE